MSAGLNRRPLSLVTDAKLRSTWTTKAAQASFAPGMPVQVGALAVLPVLPASFSSASAEPRRQKEGTDSGNQGLDALLANSGTPDSFTWNTASSHVTLTPIGEQGTSSIAPVRVSDLSGGRPSDADGPACRPGEQTSVEKQDQAPATDGRDAPSRDARTADQGAQLPKCSMDFDPDAPEQDVVAEAPAAPAASVAKAAAGGGGSRGGRQREQNETQAKSEAAAAPAAEQGEQKSASQQATDAAGSSSGSSAGKQGQAPAETSPLLVTDATKGVGAGVVDPMLPTDSVTFASDPSLLFPEKAPVGPDPVADALASAAPLPQPVVPTDYALLG